MKSDVIVVGVGGMGASAAYHLAGRGLNVVGIDQYPPAHDRGSSHGETRMIRKAYFEHSDYVPLLNRSYELWEKLSAASGRGLYHETGLFYSLKPEGEIARGIQNSSKAYHIPLQKLTGKEMGEWSQRFTVHPENLNFFEPQAGYLEVENCTLSHIHLARQLGAQFQFGETIQAIHFSADGVSVATNKQKYSADKIIFTAGAWTSKLLSDLKLPLKIRRKVLSWYKAPAIYSEQRGMPCYFIQEPDGETFYGFPDIGAGEIKCAQHSGGEDFQSPEQILREVAPEDLSAITQFVKTRMPGALAKSTRSSVCMYTMTPDEHFIIDRHPIYSAAFFACGFSGHGYKFASVVGEVLADLVEKGSTRLPISFLSQNRKL